MKTALTISLLVCLVGINSKAQIYVYDDFNDGSINPLLWNVTLPWSDSSVTEGGGVVAVQNGGRITSTMSLPMNYEVNAGFLLANNPHSDFIVNLRTDGVVMGTESKGIRFQFQIMTDPGDTSKNLWISTTFNPAGDIVSAEVSANLTLGTQHTFRITDDGFNVSLFFDGASTPNLTLQSNYRPGDLITLRNREGGAAGSWISNDGITQLDYLSITEVPEPSSLALVSIGITTLILNRRKK